MGFCEVDWARQLILIFKWRTKTTNCNCKSSYKKTWNTNSWLRHISTRSPHRAISLKLNKQIKDPLCFDDSSSYGNSDKRGQHSKTIEGLISSWGELLWIGRAGSSLKNKLQLKYLIKRIHNLNGGNYPIEKEQKEINIRVDWAATKWRLKEIVIEWIEKRRREKRREIVSHELYL